MDIKLLCEQICLGLRPSKQTVPVLTTVLQFVVGKDGDDRKMLPVIMHFAKNYSFALLDGHPKPMRVLDEQHPELELPHSNILPTEAQAGLRNILFQYFEPLFKHLEAETQRLTDLEKMRCRGLDNRREVPKEQQDKFESNASALTKLKKSVNDLSELLGLQRLAAKDDIGLTRPQLIYRPLNLVRRCPPIGLIAVRDDLNTVNEKLENRRSNEEVLTVLQSHLVFATGYDNHDTRVNARKNIIRIILPQKYETDVTMLSPEKLELLLKTFEELLSERDETVLQENYPQEHLNTLLRLTKYAEAEIFAWKYIDRFDASFGVATICLGVLKRSLQTGYIDEANQADWNMLDKLASIELQHPLVRVGKAFQAYLERKYSRSSELFDKALWSNKGLSTLPAAFQVTLLHIIELYSKKYVGISWICLAQPTNFQKAVDLLLEIKNTVVDWEVFFYAGVALVDLGNETEAGKLLQEAYNLFTSDNDFKLTVGALEAYMALERREYKTAEQLMESALIFVEKNYFFHYIFFRCLWDTQRRDPRRCLAHLERSLELFPDFAVARVYMGLWLWRESLDVGAAMEHFERAYALLPSNSFIVRSYTDFCTLDHRDALAMEILRNALESKSFKHEDRRWMRLRLALLCYQNHLWHECITSIRQISHSQVDHRLIQEFLGDALTFRGNYWSAKGTFDAVIDNAAGSEDDFADYSWYRRAWIKQKLKLDDEAEEDFLVLQTRSASFKHMCLKSLAEIELRKAKIAFSKHFSVQGVQCCQKAVDFLTEAAFSYDDTTLLWSLLGDACMLMRFCRTGRSELMVDHFLWDGTQQKVKLAINVRQALYLATVFYGVAIESKRTSCRLWERLAVAYFFLADRVIFLGDTEGGQKWMNRSMMAVSEMLLRNPYNPWVWTTAGMIVGSSHNSSAADACRLYTKSLDLFHHFKLNPTIFANTWASLGYLFVNQKRYLAAHSVLKRAQSADPMLPEAWLGQAWCAEKVNAKLEAMDLCRHACSLGLLKDAMLRYAEWVLWVLLDKTEVDAYLRREIIVRLEAIPTAVDYLLQYIQTQPETLKVSMMLSLLLEWMGLRKSALEKAKLSLAEMESREDRFEAAGMELWNMAKMNSARLLCDAGQYEEAVALIGTVESDPTISSVLLLFVVNFRLGTWDGCLALLDVAADLIAEGDVNGKALCDLVGTLVAVYSGRGPHKMKLLTNDMEIGEGIRLQTVLKAFCLLFLSDPSAFHEKKHLLPKYVQSVGWENFVANLSLLCFMEMLGESDPDNADRTLTRFIHLKPERVDFRLLLLERSLSESKEEENPTEILSGSMAIYSEIVEMKARAPYQGFWETILMFIERKNITFEYRNRVVQKVIHLFPAELCGCNILC